MPLTAKFIARRQPSDAARMAQMIRAAIHPPLLGELLGVLAATPASTVVRARVACVLDVVATLTAPDTTVQDRRG